MSEQDLSIQELSERSGLTRRTIHFYIQQGLLPPPHGAGLGAYYDEGHLLRLQLIPRLRRQGLRLDEIRRRFGEIDLTGLRSLAAQPVEISPAPDSQPVGRSYQHYNLPAGIILAVPASLSPSERRKLAELLEAARRIFVP